MKIGSKILILLVVICQNGWAQGFANLDFENAHFIVDPSGNLPPNSVYASNAIPGWTAYVGGVPQTDIFSNLPSAGSAWVSLLGTNPPSLGIFSMEPAFQGRWSIFLQGFSGNTNGFTGGAPVVASIGQTGQIPASAESLLFWGNLSLSYGNIFDVSFNGQDLSLVTISNALNYIVYGADVSRFAGQTGQLLFSAGNNTYAELDNIQFSSVSITEPSAFALAALGALFVGFRRWRTSSRWNLR